MSPQLHVGQVLLLVLIGAIASGINSVAGGGSLISFPFLTIGFRLVDTLANATNAVALWPGSFTGALAYKKHLAKTGHYFRSFIGPTLVGAVLGAYLLTRTSDASFRKIIPGLILVAATMLLLQPRIKERAKHAGGFPLWIGMVIQFFVALYGGYFGAGMGIMMLGAFCLTMEGDLNELNAIKNWLGLFINLVASALFLVMPSPSGTGMSLQGLVIIPVAIPLIFGSIIGGYLFGHFAQKIDPEKMRLVIACYGFCMAAYFFYRGFVA